MFVPGLFVFSELRREVIVRFVFVPGLFVFNELRREVIVRFVFVTGLFVFSELRRGVIVRFVHIGGIDDHQCLNCLFIKMYMYITNLVCFTYFHWFFSPECQHIFGKQTGYIFQSPKTIKT